MKVYAYLRVSTGKQDGQNQRIGIEALATARGLKIDEYIDDEGVSGTVEPEKRELGNLLKKLKSGDILLAGELSRLGRSLFMIFKILEYCMNNNVTVITAKDGYTLGNNIQSKVMAFAFGLSAEIEREMISRRTKEALALRKKSNIYIGRYIGSHNKKQKWNVELATKLLDEGFSKAEVARRVGVDRTTISRKFGVVTEKSKKTFEMLETKKTQIKTLIHNEKSPREICKKLGVSQHVFYKWIQASPHFFSDLEQKIREQNDRNRKIAGLRGRNEND